MYISQRFLSPIFIRSTRWIPIFGLALTLTVIGGVFTPAADAADLYVDASAGSGSTNGLSWANAYLTLQDALAVAVSNQTIHVAKGTYYPDEGAGQNNNYTTSSFKLLSGVAIYGGFPSGGGSLAERDPGLYRTILSGNVDKDTLPTDGGNAQHVVTGTGTDATAILDGFTITEGYATGSSPGNYGGGLLCNGSGSPQIMNCTFLLNYADFGGAMFNNTASPTLINCSFLGNQAGNFGGAICNFSSSPDILNSVFQGNRGNSTGGAIYNSSSSPDIRNASFQGNRALTGGAMYNILSSSPTLSNCILWNNDQGGYTTNSGASVVNVNASVPIYSHCLVANFSKATLDASGASPDTNLEPTDPRFLQEVNPNLSPLTGGNLRLNLGSPALDAGSNALNTSLTDRAGILRIHNTTIDLGAYENQGFRYVDGTATAPNNGSSWADAYLTVQDALATNAAGQVIFVAEGSYYPDTGANQTNNSRTSTFQLQSGASLFGGFPSGGAAFAQRDPIAYPAILSGDIDQNDGPAFANNAGNAIHVVTGTGADDSALLDGFIITAGHANGLEAVLANAGGGLICKYSGSPDIRNCSFQGNRASGYGGGIFNISAFPSLINCSFQENQAGFGGAVHNNDSSPAILNCAFQGNQADAQGGALYNYISAPEVLNSSFQGNRAVSQGGAMFNNTAFPVLSNCIIWNNQEGTSTTATGASAANINGSTPAYDHCIVANFSKATLDATVSFPKFNYEPLDPRFFHEVNPASAPTTGGDLRLAAGSPAIDIGLNTANRSSTDLAGNARIHDITNSGIIDLGAFETQGDFRYVDASATGANNGSSWANAHTRLQNALAITGPGDTLYVAEGLYYPDEGTIQTNNNRSSTFKLLPGVAIYGGFPSGGSPFAQRNPAAYPSILSGDIDKINTSPFGDNTGNAYHVLTGTGADSDTILDGFLITGGHANGTAPHNAGGGLLCNGSGAPSIRNCSFQGNQASSTGGAIHNNAASPEFINCSFLGNLAGTSGGAMYNTSSSPDIRNGSFQGNRADTAGGAIYNLSSSPVLRNSILWNNQEGASTSSPGASVVNATSTPIYAHCLIANLSKATLDGTGISPDTNFEPTNPLFFYEVDPASAPTTGGNLRLTEGSPAIDTGLNTDNPTSIDLAGHSRIQDTIDLGAFESQGFLYVDRTATAPNNGSSWADAFLTVQDALAAGSPGQALYVAEGLYYPDEGANQTNNIRSSTFQLLSGLALYGGFPTGGGSYAQRDPAAHPAILSGDIDQNDGPNFANNAGNAFHVVTGTDSDASTFLDGFTITAGHADGAAPDNAGGGFIFNGTGSPNLLNCSFQGNQAFLSGGAMYNFASYGFSATPIIHSCSFEGNQSITSYGGAMYNLFASPDIQNCSFAGNLAPLGGGMYNRDSSPFIGNVSFQGNRGLYGGGAIYNLLSFPALSNCILWNNQEESSTSTKDASIFNSSSLPAYSHCIVANYSKVALDTFGNSPDTNFEPVNPLFLQEVNPALAPVIGGNLRLTAGSPAIDAGLNSAHTPSFDLAGNPRIHNTIDLGAFETQRGFLYVDHTAVGSNNGLSWSNAFLNIQDALAVVVAGETIYVAAGSYYPDEGANQTNNARSSTFQLQSGVALYGGFPAGGGPFAQRNSTIHHSILSGDLDQNDGPGFTGNAGNAFHVLTGTGTDATALLDGFTITAGHADGLEADLNNAGGGLICKNSGSPSIRHCSFQGNRASGYGGGIFNISATPSIGNCSFQGNQAGFHGGAVHNNNSSPDIINGSFQGNQAGFQGGAVYNYLSAPDLQNGSFQGNRAATGGAMYNISASPTLSNCILWNNQEGASTTNPGASVANSSSTPTYTHCLIANSGGSGSWNVGLGTDLDGNIDTNPLFLLEVNPASAPVTGGDLHLTGGSPAIDAGLNTANAFTTDLAGNPRLQNAAIDLGAFEWGFIYVDRSASAPNTGMSWEDAFLTLQDALAIAAPEQVIAVAEGTYYPDEGAGQTNNNRSSTFQLLPGVALYGGFPSGGSSFAVRDPAVYPVILSGDLDQNDEPFFFGRTGNAYHVLTGTGTDAATLIDGVTIFAGNATGGSFPDSHGAGLLCLGSGSLRINNCSFLSNQAASYGGGMYNDSSVPDIRNSSFLGNRAEFGGAMHNKASSPIIHNSTFQTNESFGSAGAMFNTDSSSPTISGSLFLGNQADFDGGAMYNSSTSSPTISASVFIGNWAASDGGAMVNASSSSPELRDCSFLGNQASEVAGAMYNLSFSSPDIVNCSFQGNRAGPADGGGAMFNNGFSSPALSNCILWNNQAGSSTTSTAASVANVSSSTSTYTHCLIANSGGSGVGWKSILGTDLGSNIDDDPLFLLEVDPASAPVTGGDLRLDTGSPAIDTGLNSVVSTTTDLDGNPRIINAVVDMGAYENQFGVNPDPDGDGFSNDEELIAGTSPSDPNSFWKVTGAGGSSSMTFDSVIDRVYSAESCTNLIPIPQTWTVFTNNIPGTGNPILITYPTAADQLNVRVKVRLAP